uniref:tRNA (32-2'-O)-methyltransferase regulator THADA n=1 Tax=Poecilia mexicana TaxID=48701 RepID=A0A3B3YNB9_9TELE
QLRCEALCMSGRPPGVALYLSHGALAMLGWKGSLPGPQWEELLLLVPETLVKESSTAMVVARVLTLWSGAALDCLQEKSGLCPPSLQVALRGGSILQRHLLEHIYSHWEHPLDGVRHQTRSLFHNLLLLHRCTKPADSDPADSDPASDPYVAELTRSLLGLEWHMRGKYGSLGCLVELYGAEHLLGVQPRLPSLLLDLMGDQTLAPYASDLLERLFVSHKAQLAAQESDWMELWHRTWVNPLLDVLCHTRPDQTTYILDYFLPKLLRCSPSSLAHMVRALQGAPPCRTGPSSSRGALGALMTCLRAARAQGVAAASEESLWGGLIQLSLLQQALIHKHDQVRMDALGLVCESHRSTEVLTSQEMDLIRHFLPPNLNSQSPGVRQQTVSLMKKVSCFSADPFVSSQVPETMLSVLRAALDLSTSTKPYDSVTAAHLLHLLLQQPDLIPVLLRCDPGLDLQIRPEASRSLILELNALTELSGAEASLLQAAASFPLYGRVHCITAVLQRLNTDQTEQWTGLVSELIAVCYRMSDVVSPVVQSSSPEGLIPMDTDSETTGGLQRILQEIQPRDSNDFFNSARELEKPEGDDQSLSSAEVNFDGEGYRVTAQMVLVCCWRSMKEVAMLLGQLCQTLPLHYTQQLLLLSSRFSLLQVEGVGLYFRQQLLQSRHRGAFELAYVGFVRLTDMLCRCVCVRNLQQLPTRWLSEVLEEVKSSDPTSKLCATRRSAGIPFYIQALLSSEPKASSCSLLKATMKQLIALASPAADRSTDASTVPQVHALNILRALYRDTRLGENIIPFVSEGMQAAVLGFTSPVWAVRNSSTLLFSTLITRIFGVKRGKDEHSKKNRMTGREFFTRFPALYPFLLSQLEEAASTVESLFLITLK